MPEQFDFSAALVYLALSAGLALLMWLPYILARLVDWGIADTVGYPDPKPAEREWAVRARRAHANHIESLAPFGVLVLVAEMIGASPGLTAFGAGLFFWARLVHYVVYAAGVPWARTLAFTAAWVGMLLVFIGLFI
jgi:uncharacterized MAPEG superfamily protein